MECSIGIVFERSNLSWLGPARQKLCMIQRIKDPFFGYYEFPGGQVNENEKPFDTLTRELSEELGINESECVLLTSGQRVSNEKVHVSFLGKIKHHYSSFNVDLNIYIVSLPENTELFSKEKREIAFINPFYDNFKFIDSTYRILRLFEIPRQLYIAEDENHLDIWKKIMYQINSIRIRNTKNNQRDYERLVTKFIDSIINSDDLNYSSSYLSHAHNHRLLIVDNIDIYRKIPFEKRKYIGGFHFNSTNLKNIAKTNIDFRDNMYQYISCSCHTKHELEIAESLNMDFALLSPVLTKKGSNDKLGWEGFKLLTQAVNIPIIAMGGMDKDQKCLDQSLLNGGFGISGINKFWEN